MDEADTTLGAKVEANCFEDREPGQVAQVDLTGLRESLTLLLQVLGVTLPLIAAMRAIVVTDSVAAAVAVLVTVGPVEPLIWAALTASPAFLVGVGLIGILEAARASVENDDLGVVHVLGFALVLVAASGMMLFSPLWGLTLLLGMVLLLILALALPIDGTNTGDETTSADPRPHHENGEVQDQSDMTDESERRFHGKLARLTLRLSQLGEWWAKERGFLLFALPILAVLLTLASQTFWRPVEVIEVSGEEDVTAYVLSEDGDWWSVLYDYPRLLGTIRSEDVVDRTVCDEVRWLARYSDPPVIYDPPDECP